MHGHEEAPGFGPGTYGRSFAEVYDDWYPADPTASAAVDRLGALAGDGGSLLELGVGTGRLAIPLALGGHRVTGVDASPEMLALLARKAEAAGAKVDGVLGDVGDPDQWPATQVDVVVAAFNLVFNLADAGAQRRCFDAAAATLRDGGAFVVETFLPAPVDERERRLEVREIAADRVVLIATDSDPVDGTVKGQHIELVDGQPVRLRPWRIRVAGIDELDEMAERAGLVLSERHGDWQRSTFDPHGAGQVSVYRRG